VLRKLPNLAVLVSLVALAAGLVWDYATDRYVKGVADAIVSPVAPAERRVESIPDWLERRMARLPAGNHQEGSVKDPVDIVNDRELLRICGSATNAFVSLATRSGVEARRLLLLNDSYRTKHVTAEVRLGGRWVVVDPALHRVLRDAAGRPVSKEELRDPRVFREAALSIPGYSESYTFERTAYFRLEKIPYAGRPLRAALNRVYPGWDERVNWVRVWEWPSTDLIMAAVVMLALSLCWRFALWWSQPSRSPAAADMERPIGVHSGD
jgi:hypothetical protein